MTLADVKEMLERTGLPVAYHHFKKAPSVPFIVYHCPEDAPFNADDQVYHNSRELEIELYTDQKDEATERMLELLLEEHELPYRRFENWIDSEKLYQQIYETRLI